MQEMRRTKSQFARLMELDRAIRGGEFPNCLSFAADWEVSQKTIQRDIDYLRDQCGAPIAYDRKNRGFYYEDDTWMLPSTMLTEGELLSVLLGAKALAQYRGAPVEGELRRVFGKFTELLPETISIRPELLYSEFSFRSPPAKPVNPTVWAVVVRGLIDQVTVEVAYRPFEEKTQKNKTSTINPYHIANLQGEWYVFAVHDGYDDVRQFALARIETAKLTNRGFAVPEDFDIEPLLSSAFGRYAGNGKEHTIRLLFDKEIADWITERQWHPKQKLKRRRDGNIELTFPAKGLYEVQRWVLSWGASVKVDSPKELRKAVADEIAAMQPIQ